MKISTAIATATTLATVATFAPLASAAGYSAAWTITGAACGGQIKLGEYTAATADKACSAADCKPIMGQMNVSTKTTCVDSHITGANEVLKANPYVLVEVYKANSSCTGDFAIAIGVTADGTCIPGTDGKASYNVTWSAEKGALWLQYADGMCAGEATTVPFPPAATDGNTCTAGFLKALAVAPSSATKPEGSEANATTTKPAMNMTSGSKDEYSDMATTMPVMATPMTTAPGANAASTTAPAAASAASSSSMVSVAAVAAFAVASVALV